MLKETEIYATEKPLIVLAAGGKGTRIKSINDSVPKPMIPIAGKPILQWEIEMLVSQGYLNILITVGYMKESIISYFGNGERFGCHIEYYEEETPLGNFGSVYKLWEEGRINDTFLFLIADAIFDFDIGRMLEYHRNNNSLATLFVHPNSHPYDSGIVITDENNVVVKWLNKEDVRPRYYKNLVNAGLHIFSTELLELSQIPPSEVGNSDRYGKVDLDRDVLKPLLSTGRIFSYKSTEYVKDAGTPDRFHSVEKDILSGRVKSRNLCRHQKAVFLDRDGTINKYVGFLRSIDSFELIEGVAEAVRMINESGYLAIVITNQPVIARGEVTWNELNEIHQKMETLLGRDGAYLDGIYVCPHHPDRGFEGEVVDLKYECDCRKPKPGLLYQAALDFNIDLSESIVIGDSWRDVECGLKAGCKSILLNGENTELSDKVIEGEYETFDNLLNAVKNTLVN